MYPVISGFNRTFLLKPLCLLLCCLPTIVEASASHKFRVDTREGPETCISVVMKDTTGKTLDWPMDIKVNVAGSNQIAKNFRLYQDSSRNVCQSIPAGTYDLTIRRPQSSIMSAIILLNVPVAGMKQNTVIVETYPGTLVFAYMDADGNPTDRPVKEFYAMVERSGSVGQFVVDCDKETPLTPGRYNIEVGSLPVFRFDDIESDPEVPNRVLLPQPGWLLVTNNGPEGEFVLKPVSDNDRAWRSVIREKVKNQKLMVMPGSYEISWLSPKHEKAQIFSIQIQSDKTTTLELK